MSVNREARLIAGLVGVGVVVLLLFSWLRLLDNEAVALYHAEHQPHLDQRLPLAEGIFYQVKRGMTPTEVREVLAPFGPFAYTARPIPELEPIVVTSCEDATLRIGMLTQLAYTFCYHPTEGVRFRDILP